MQSFEITVIRQKRLFLVFLLLAVSATLLLYLETNLEIPYQKILIPIILGITIVVVLYYYLNEKMLLNYSFDKINIVWIKRFLFDNKEIESINVNEIKILVVDEGIYLRKIIMNKRIVEINNVSSIENEFSVFIKKLIRTVEYNEGKVINSKQYRQMKGYNDFSFHLLILVLAFSIFIIPRVWSLFEYYSLLFLFLPLFAYINHIIQRIKKKIGGNK